MWSGLAVAPILQSQEVLWVVVVPVSIVRGCRSVATRLMLGCRVEQSLAWLVRVVVRLQQVVFLLSVRSYAMVVRPTSFQADALQGVMGEESEVLARGPEQAVCQERMSTMGLRVVQAVARVVLPYKVMFPVQRLTFSQEKFRWAVFYAVAGGLTVRLE